MVKESQGMLLPPRRTARTSPRKRGQGVFTVNRWAEEPTPKDLPVVGQPVELPIRIAAYVQGGVPKRRLVWETDEASDSF